MPGLQVLSVSLSQSLPVTGCGWHTLPSTLNSLAKGLGYPSPRGSSLYNPDILVPFPLSSHGYFHGPSPWELPKSNFPINLHLI